LLPNFYKHICRFLQAFLPILRTFAGSLQTLL
jgi:hypothetical protein